MNLAIFLSIITQLFSIYLIYLIAIAISSWQIIGKNKQNLYKFQQVSREKLYRNFKYHLESLSRFTEEKAGERRGKGAEGQRCGGAEEQRCRGAEEQRSRGAEEQRRKISDGGLPRTPAPLRPCAPAPLHPTPYTLHPTPLHPCPSAPYTPHP